MPRRWKRLGLALAVALASASSALGGPMPGAEAYLDRAIELIRRNHLNSSRADWPRIVAQARRRIAGATRSADTYSAIRGVLEALGERHSFLLEPRAAVPGWTQAGPDAVGGEARDRAPRPSWQLVDGRFGLVRLPQLDTMGAGGEAVGNAYAANIRSGLQLMDGAALCGWIVDLRENGGGNMWPMLAGLDPLLGAPPFGYFVGRAGSTEAWVRAGGTVVPTSAAVPESPPAYSLEHGSAPVAVLIGPLTASSGEMTAIALIGRVGVRTFGSPSAGFTTANRSHPLPDGAFLLIAETTVRDRTGRDYPGPIMPDDQVAPNEVEAAARGWLAGRCDRRP